MKAGLNKKISRTLPPRAVDGFERKKMKRRRHQDGQLIELQDGYAVRYYTNNSDGPRRRVQKFLGNFKELPTARAAKNVMQAELTRVNQTVTVVSNSTLTFRVAAEAWIKDSCERKKKPIRASVACTYRGILRNHLLPILGEHLVESCRAKAMRSTIDRLDKKGLSAQTIKGCVAVTKLVIQSVVDEDLNPLYLTNWSEKALDMPDSTEPNTPCFTSEEVTQIVGAATGRFRMAVILLASTGLRISELVGLEVRHFNGDSLKVEQAVWNQTVGKTKTESGNRSVDLAPEVAALLREFIGERTSGFILQSCSRKPITAVNLLKRDLHPTLDVLGIRRCGFHSFRRYRNTFLCKSECPESLLKFWMGHKRQGMTALYDKSSKDLTYRKDVAKSMGVGFSLPKQLTPTLLQGVSGRLPESTETLETVNSRA